VFTLAALGTGCNVLSLPFFIFGPEPKIEAKMQKLARDDKDKDKDKEVKVAILAYSPLEVRPEFVRVDRDLSLALANSLKKGFEYNKELVKVISPRKVEDYKQSHPEWRLEDLDKIGQDLGVDYVIYLEIKSISIYERGSYNQLYRGQAEIDVSLAEVKPKDEGFGNKTEHYVCTYPTDARGAVPNDPGSNPLVFRDSFYRYMAEQLSWYFTSHPTDQDYKCQ
jgi:hypothetical protein